MIQDRKKESISCRFQLEQRKIYSRNNNSYEDILLKIAVLFEVPLRTVKKIDSEIYCVSVNSIKSLAKVKNYFEIYPLMSLKYLDYQCWLIAYNMILEKYHLTEIGKEKILSL
jgi:hypothetical protein